MITVGLASFAKPNNSTRIAAASNFTNYNGVLVEPCSIMKPLIKFEGVQVWNYNYAYISQFSRYYFIDDYYTENGFWYAQMTVDVLASFKTSIGSSTQYIERAANKQNAYALDMFYPTTADYSSSSVLFNPNASPIMGLRDGIFAINVTGSTSSIVSSYMCDFETFKAFVTALWAFASDIGVWGNLDQGIVNSLFEPYKHIGSVVWFPNDESIDGWDDGNYVTHITIGSWTATITGVGQKFYPVSSILGGIIGTVTLPKHPQAATYGKYLNIEPYSRYIYQDDVFGSIQMNASALAGLTTASVSKYSDPLTGMQKLVLPDGQQRMAMGGVLVPMENNSLNLGGIFSSVGTAANGLMTGDLASVVSGSLGAVTNFLQPVVTQTGQSGSTLAHNAPPRIFAEFWKTPTQYPTRYGKLYCTQDAINTVSGYVKCKDAHWQNNKAFADEIQMVEAYMNGGMFYE